MTDQQYIEFKVRLAADRSFMKRLVLEVLREEISPSVERKRDSGITVLRKAPPGHITYREAAEMIGVRQDCIRRQVSTEQYGGGGGFLVEAEFRTYIMTRSRKQYREHLVQWDEERQRKKDRHTRRLGVDTPVLDLFKQTA
jgi:hypothetical protein